MFESGKVYTNRYNDEYSWHKIADNVYQFTMSGDGLAYCRFGGKQNQLLVDYNDLGMFDPSGGPCVTPGMKIDSRPIVRIFVEEKSNNVCVEVSDENSQA